VNKKGLEKLNYIDLSTKKKLDIKENLSKQADKENPRDRPTRENP
jgi:hypothetical protein